VKNLPINGLKKLRGCAWPAEIAEGVCKGSLSHYPPHISGRISMIEAIIKMTVPAEKRKEVLQTIKAILGPIRRERGCISCNCSVDVEDERIFFFKEEWDTRDDLDNHLRSGRYGVLIGAMSLLKAAPDIRFNTIVSTAGAEEIKAERA
jgi:quinol monooxygenase YgiN